MKLCIDCDRKIYNDDFVDNSSGFFCKCHYTCFAKYDENNRCKNYRKRNNIGYDIFCESHNNNSQYYKFLYNEKKNIECRNSKQCIKPINDINCKKILKQLLECDIITRRCVYLLHKSARDITHEFFITYYIDKSINKINEQSYDYLIKDCKKNCNNSDISTYMKLIRKEYKQKISNIRQNKKIENFNNKYQ